MATTRADTAMVRRHGTLLRIVAWLETATLVILVGNLLTVHAGAVTHSVGPLHGGLYVVCAVGAVAARWLRLWSWPMVIVSILPAIGGLFVIERLRRDG